jgi:uncharacterized membrane protein
LRASRVCLTLGLLVAASLFPAAIYFFSRANRTVEEDAPTDVWFAVSAFGGFAALIVAPTLLVMAQQYRRRAEARI